MEAVFRGEDCPHLTTGQSYTVLAVEGTHLRVIDDGGAPSLFATLGWEIVPQEVAQPWVLSLEDEDLCLGPKPFMEPGFFEDVFDGVRPSCERFLSVASRTCTPSELARFQSWFDGKVARMSVP